MLIDWRVRSKFAWQIFSYLLRKAKLLFNRGRYFRFLFLYKSVRPFVIILLWLYCVNGPCTYWPPLPFTFKNMLDKLLFDLKYTLCMLLTLVVLFILFIHLSYVSPTLLLCKKVERITIKSRFILRNWKIPILILLWLRKDWNGCLFSPPFVDDPLEFNNNTCLLIKISILIKKNSN